MTFSEVAGAEITFEHHPAASELWRYFQVQPHTGLALRNAPGTDVAAFSAAKANLRIDFDCTLARLFYRAKRAELAAGCIKAVHTTARSEKDLVTDFYSLDEEPVVWT